MNIKRILCPVDFSEYNHAANDYASMLAKSSGARIIYLHAFLPDVNAALPAHFDSEKELKQMRRELEDFIKPAQDQIVAAYIIEWGRATEAIVQYADENDIDLIVMGTHGRTGLSRMLMGSVAEAVVRKAECPVLAIKADANVLQEC